MNENNTPPLGMNIDSSFESSIDVDPPIMNIELSNDIDPQEINMESNIDPQGADVLSPSTYLGDERLYVYNNFFFNIQDRGET